MQALRYATQSEGMVDRRNLDRFQRCLDSPTIDLQLSIDLILSDSVLLASVIRLANRVGGCDGALLSDCVVMCGRSRLLRLCNLLIRQHPCDSEYSSQLADSLDSYQKLVC
jgi:hypothetical protein